MGVAELPVYQFGLVYGCYSKASFGDLGYQSVELRSALQRMLGLV